MMDLNQEEAKKTTLSHRPKTVPFISTVTLPRLARYMGHAGAQFTHYYLKFTEPLRCAASDRFHQHMAGTVLPPADRQKGGVR